ncbi:MAG TPA: nucleotidyltransferase family protein [Nitrosopumilaceae archaeon]|nr:nucleotidyltransferase family protein [Nitrosopumilaceae archaeon]
MKAVILAGGKGTRGKPYTDYFPKAMIPLNGKPLIDYILKHLSSYDFISEIIIISDFKGLGGQIKNFLEGSKYKKKISFVQDSQSGTAGDLLHIRKKLTGTEFVLWFADNLSPINLKKMLQTFKKKKSIACIATRSFRKEETGFAIVKDDIIQEFKEKPSLKLNMSECLGIYILSNKILDKIKPKFKQKEVNLSFDILEKLSKNNIVSAYDIGTTPWLDVESPVVIDRYQSLVKKIIKQMGH